MNARRSCALIASLSLLIALPGSASAESALEIVARVATMHGERELSWIEVHVEGDSEAARERCARLVRELGRTATSAASTLRVLRACDPQALPPREGPRRVVLRTERPLPATELFAMGAPGTRGRIVTDRAMRDLAECERVRDAPAGTSSALWASDEATARAELEAERRACGGAAELEAKHFRAHRRPSRARRVELELARKACSAARERRQAERASVDAGASRTCVWAPIASAP